MDIASQKSKIANRKKKEIHKTQLSKKIKTPRKKKQRGGFEGNKNTYPFTKQQFTCQVIRLVIGFKRQRRIRARRLDLNSIGCWDFRLGIRGRRRRGQAKTEHSRLVPNTLVLYSECRSLLLVAPRDPNSRAVV